MLFFLDRLRSDAIFDTSQLAHDIAQHLLGSDLLNHGKASKPATVHGSPDVMAASMLGPILQDVHDTTICLMRLSRPLLNNHQRHESTPQRCDQDDTHHVSHLQRLLPHATLTLLKRLSKSICARRLELLHMNSHRERLNLNIGDDAFLRVVLLEMASVSDEAVKYESSKGSSPEADSGRLKAEPCKFENVEYTKSVDEESVSSSIGKVDSVFNSSEYMLEHLEATKINIVQRREGPVYKSTSQAGQKAKEASYTDQEPLDDISEAFTVDACTRCRIVRLSRTQRSSYAYIE